MYIAWSCPSSEVLEQNRKADIQTKFRKYSNPKKKIKIVCFRRHTKIISGLQKSPIIRQNILNKVVFFNSFLRETLKKEASEQDL